MTAYNTVNFKESERVKLREFQDQNKMRRIPLCEQSSGLGVTQYIELDGQLQGIGTIAKNGFHPNFDHLYFAVIDHNSDVIQSLFTSLTSNRAVDAAPLQIMYHESEIAEQRPFAEKHGFRLVVTSHCPEIDVDASIKKIINPFLPNKLRVLSYNQLTSIEKSALRTFRLNGYFETHFWSPPIDINDQLWQKTDLIAEEEAISWCVFKDEKPILCSDIRLDGDEVWLGWGWHNDELGHLDAITQAWSKILNLQLAYCQRSGKRLFGEFDSVDRYGQIKSALLVHLTKDAHYIFQQKGKV